MKFNLNQLIWVAGMVALVLLVAFLIWWQWEINIIDIENKKEENPASLTGLNCDNYNKRPIAVMMASDPIARPLSGISQADVVIEMPVTPNGITRMVAMFQCEEPEEIGSIRSAREDFLPLIKSFEAIYAHWGGEREALKKLDDGVLDNIDAMKYEGTVFYRKNSVPRPHNGFTTIKFLADKAKDLEYNLSDMFSGYVRNNDKPEKNLNNLAETIAIDYENPYDVKWIYDNNLNAYKRIRGGEAETDKNTGEQVQANIVILMYTTSKFLNRDYISVVTTGEGRADFYQNGIKASGMWKNNNNDGLRFYSTKSILPTPGGIGVSIEASGEMEFVLGKMWIEIVAEPSG